MTKPTVATKPGETAAEILDDQGPSADQLSAELNAHEEQGQTNPVMQSDKPAQEELTSTGVAVMAVMGVSKVAVNLYPCLEGAITPPVQEEAVQKLAPLMEKYNVKSEFFEKWRLELEAGFFFAGLIFQCYKLIEADKAANAVKTPEADDVVKN